MKFPEIKKWNFYEGNSFPTHYEDNFALTFYEDNSISTFYEDYCITTLKKCFHLWIPFS